MPAFRSCRFPRIRKSARILSVPAFLLTATMAIRTACIGTSDIFVFGRCDHWVCYADINSGHIAVALYIFEPGCAPGFAWPKGPFFHHAQANDVAWGSYYGKNSPDSSVDHGNKFLGWGAGYRKGALADTAYWLSLPFAPPALLALSSLILAHWNYVVRKSRRARRAGLCPSCSYDLRAHHPGEKCPECGTPIVTHPNAHP